MLLVRSLSSADAASMLEAAGHVLSIDGEPPRLMLRNLSSAEAARISESARRSPLLWPHAGMAMLCEGVATEGPRTASSMEPRPLCSAAALSA